MQQKHSRANTVHTEGNTSFTHWSDQVVGWMSMLPSCWIDYKKRMLQVVEKEHKEINVAFRREKNLRNKYIL